MRKEYYKLVRDRIPEIIENDGRLCEVKVASEEEYIELLLAKLIEEAREVASARDDKLVEELADLYEVISSLVAVKGIDDGVVRQAQEQRRVQRGGFDKRLCLLWTE